MLSKFCLGTLVALQLTAVGVAREWTDSTGTRSREADLLAVQGESIILLLPDGGLAKSKLGCLSEKDRAFVLKFAEASAETAKSPATLEQVIEQPNAANQVTITPVAAINLVSLAPTAGGNLTPASEVLTPQHQPPQGSNVMLAATRIESKDEGASLFLVTQPSPSDVPKAQGATDGDDVHLVYTGKIGTFHLFGGTGTGLFWYAEPFSKAEQYFVQLTPVKTPPSRWLFYKPVQGGTPFATQFAFDRNPTYRKGYAVWILDLRNTWHLFEYAHRQPRGDYWPPGS